MLKIYSVDWTFFKDVFTLKSDEKTSRYYSDEDEAIADINRFLAPFKSEPDDYLIFHMPDEEISFIFIKILNTSQMWNIVLTKHYIQDIDIHLA